MRKLLTGLIVGTIFLGYYIFLRKPADSQPMTQELCEEQGGVWGEMEIMRETGDEVFFQCECPNTSWVREGQLGSCR